MRLIKLRSPFSGARPKQEAQTERVSGGGQRSPAERQARGPSAWPLEHRLLWLAVIALTVGALLFGPAASFMLTLSGAGPAVNAALAFLFVMLLWLMRRHYEIIDKQREEFLGRAERLEKSYDAIVPVLLRTAVDFRDPRTAEQSARISELTAMLARHMGLRQQNLRDITLAATLHDVGRLGMAEAALSKPGSLSDEERTEIREHPRMGYEILKGIDFMQGFLKGAAEIIYAHHERYDGTGYPQGLAGEKIPLGARIFALVDTYDAVTSQRPYRRARSHDEAVQEIEGQVSTQFDPAVVAAFLKANEQGLIQRANHERLEIDEPRAGS
ncbi:MAG: HD domain-containing protein [Anaerolineales bacterium]|nr:MAG: HD domain-containing protein [Anaerolineales bacterium]